VRLENLLGIRKLKELDGYSYLRNTHVWKKLGSQMSFWNDAIYFTVVFFSCTDCNNTVGIALLAITVKSSK